MFGAGDDDIVPLVLAHPHPDRDPDADNKLFEADYTPAPVRIFHGD